MFKRLFTVITLLLALSVPLLAGTESAESGEADATPATVPAEELKAAMQGIMDLYRSGVTDSGQYSSHLDKLEALYGTIDAGMLEERFSVLVFKGMVYQNILDDLPAARHEYERISKAFAGTEMAAKGEKLVAQIDMLESLSPGGEFPGFSFTDLGGKTISLGDYRGKVVLIDFWATWCPPCIAELPHVLETYRKYNDKGFEIIGISLDSDKEKLEKFIADEGMDWPQYFDGKGWENELSSKYAVNSIPATFLIGSDGRIIARSLRGDDLEKAVAKAIEAL